jgi:hypothetical protein
MEVGAFLTHLAAERGVATATQNQAKAALLFLYGQVLHVELPRLEEIVTGRTQRKLPVVLTPSEVRLLFHELSGVSGTARWHAIRAAHRLPEASGALRSISAGDLNGQIPTHRINALRYDVREPCVSCRARCSARLPVPPGPIGLNRRCCETEYSEWDGSQRAAGPVGEQTMHLHVAGGNCQRALEVWPCMTARSIAPI